MTGKQCGKRQRTVPIRFRVGSVLNKMKTNKSYSKRLKVSKNGKIRGRKPGQNHFNAKERRRAQMRKKREVSVLFSNKTIARFLSF